MPLPAQWSRVPLRQKAPASAVWRELPEIPLVGRPPSLRVFAECRHGQPTRRPQAHRVSAGAGEGGSACVSGASALTKVATSAKTRYKQESH